MAERTLFVLNSEWTRLRRTGLSELSRVPSIVNSLHGRWRQAFLIVPDYSALHCPQLQGQLATILGAAPELVPVPLHCQLTIKPEASGARINGALPSDRRVWEQFARNAVDFIRHTSADGAIDVLAIDWPMAPVLGMLPRSAHSCFTIDLPPHDSVSRTLWKEGLEHACTIHVPTNSWLNHVVEQFPEVGAFRHKAKTMVFGTKIVEGFSLNSKAQKKLTIQRARGFDEDERALLLVARNRWSADDQKNNEALAAIIPRLLESGASSGWKLQFVIGPLGAPDSGRSRKVHAELQQIASRFNNRVYFETRDDIGRLPWADLLDAADAQLLPSRYEPSGIAHAQGMARGVVPICASVGAMAQCPVTHRNSFRFQAGDEDPVGAFYRCAMDAMRVFFNKPNRWRRMQASALAAAGFYNWHTLARRYESLFPMPPGPHRPEPG